LSLTRDKSTGFPRLVPPEPATPAETPAPATELEADDVAPAVGANLRRLRSKLGLSLERLARRSGVSRAMLSQIELGQSAPTITTLWKIARALGVTFSALIVQPEEVAPRVLSAAGARLLTNSDGTFTSRALFPFGEPRRTEFYELRLKPNGRELAPPHPPGTVENLVVTAGAVEIGVGRVTYDLCAGDAILFGADVEHHYLNQRATEAVMYLVMTYAANIGNGNIG
jgi:transcriptional regulator with XRE-family HTH domain